MQIVVTPENSGLRLDKFLVLQLDNPDVSREKINKWIKQGRARINGQVCVKPNYRISPGDEVEFFQEQTSGKCEPVPGELDIKYLDKDLLVLNKSPGLNVHPAPSETDTTLVHHLLYHFPEMQSLHPERPGIVHRLDKETSGLMLVGRNSRAVDALSRDIADRNMYKEYLALVHGVPGQDSGEIDYPLGRDPVSRTRMKVLPEQGREALSKYRLLHVFPGKAFSLLRVRIITGRTHQIRVHLAHMGHPVLGDSLYGNQKFKLLRKKDPLLYRLITRQMLHSWKAGFYHPFDHKWLDFAQPVPRDFKRALLQLERTGLRLGITGPSASGKSLLMQNLQRGRIDVRREDAALCKEFEPGADGWEMFLRTFGEKYFTPTENKLDKQKILSEMQNSRELKSEVLALLKPLVEHRLQNILQEFANTAVLAVEIPDWWSAVFDPRDYFHILVFVWEEGLVERESLNCSNEEIACSNLLDKMLSDTKRLASQADLILCNFGEESEMQRKSRALENILLGWKRKRIKKFCNELRDMGVI